MKNNNVNAGTVARTICLALALINQLLTMTGHSMINIDDATITNTVSEVWLIVAASWAWWKNNSFTDAAIEADRYLTDLRETTEALLQVPEEEGGEEDDN